MSRPLKRFVAGALMALVAGGCAESKPQGPTGGSPEVPTASAEPPTPVEPPVVGPAPSGENPVPRTVRRADYAITKIDLGRASDLLEGEVGPDAARARARLAIYRADCEGALSHLASSAARKADGADILFDLATRCSGATAGATIVTNEKAGVWLRIQDESDRLLVPLLTDVIVRARAALEKDLGVDLPRPLRLDLVRDLFSLSAVSGLPLESAETTGTVAVARWGRVTMVSPRAMSRGFPWADTLAHEITHLLLSRATADRAPLWLQEGIAKREEHRWREAQAFDDVPNFAERAYKAQVEGKSVGVDAIGPSIAMLPSAEAASIAFAEVTTYMDFWIAQNGPHALSLLLRELEVAEDADAAMRGVSGYGVGEWQLLWREALAKEFAVAEMSEEEETTDELGPRALSRAMRLTELLTVAGFTEEAAELSSPHLDRAAHSAALRFLAARAAMFSTRDDVDFLLGDIAELDGPHAGWLALKAFTRSQRASDPEARRLLAQARGLDPLLPEVACGGEPWVGKEATEAAYVSKSKNDLDELCLQTRNEPVRGSR